MRMMSGLVIGVLVYQSASLWGVSGEVLSDLELLTLITEVREWLVTSWEGQRSPEYCSSAQDYVDIYRDSGQYQELQASSYFQTPLSQESFAGSENLRLLQLQDFSCTLTSDNWADCLPAASTTEGRMHMLGAALVTAVVGLVLLTVCVPCMYFRACRFRQGRRPRRFVKGTQLGVYGGFVLSLVGLIVLSAIGVSVRELSESGENVGNCGGAVLGKRMLDRFYYPEIASLFERAQATVSETAKLLNVVSLEDFDDWTGLSESSTAGVRFAEVGSANVNNYHSLVFSADARSLASTTTTELARVNSYVEMYKSMVSEATSLNADEFSPNSLSRLQLEAFAGVWAYLVKLGLKENPAGTQYITANSWVGSGFSALIALTTLALFGVAALLLIDMPSIQTRRYREAIDIRPLSSRRAGFVWLFAAAVAIIGFSIGSAGIAMGFIETGSCLVAYDSANLLDSLLVPRLQETGMFTENAITIWADTTKLNLNFQDTGTATLVTSCTTSTWELQSAVAGTPATGMTTELTAAVAMIDAYLAAVIAVALAPVATPPATTAFDPNTVYYALAGYGFIYTVANAEYTSMQALASLAAPTGASAANLAFYKLLVGAVPSCAENYVTYDETNMAIDAKTRLDAAVALYGWTRTGKVVSVPTMEKVFENPPVSLGVTTCTELKAFADTTAFDTVMGTLATPWREVLRLKWQEMNRLYPCVSSTDVNCSYDEFVANTKTVGAHFQGNATAWAAKQTTMGWTQATTLATAQNATVFIRWQNYTNENFISTAKVYSFCENNAEQTDSIMAQWRNTVSASCGAAVGGLTLLAFICFMFGVLGVLITATAFTVWRKLVDNDDIQRDMRKERRLAQAQAQAPSATGATRTGATA